MFEHTDKIAKAARNNDKEEKLFQLLQKAYVGDRYEPDCSITLHELEKIRSTVMELKEILNGLKSQIFAFIFV